MPGRRPCSALCRSLAFLAAALLGPATAHAADGDPAAGKRQTITCNGCHGQSSMKNVPLLGGQDPVYFVAAMRAYQDGTRPHATMRDVAKGLSDRDLRHLAAWYSQPPATAVEGTPAAAPPEAAPCVSCHGDEGTTPALPGAARLAGQRSAVVMTALREYREGKRAHVDMQAQARDLTDDAISALATYFASRTGLFLR